MAAHDCRQAENKRNSWRPWYQKFDKAAFRDDADGLFAGSWRRWSTDERARTRGNPLAANRCSKQRQRPDRIRKDDVLAERRGIVALPGRHLVTPAAPPRATLKWAQDMASFERQQRSTPKWDRVITTDAIVHVWR